MKQKTERKKLESKLEKLITQKLYEKYGNVCQICKKEYHTDSARGMGQFHVISKGAFPNLKYRPENILWSGWYCCHYIFHHDFYKARDVVVPMIKKQIGDDYEDRLKRLSNELPSKTSMFELEKLYEYWSAYK